MVNVAIVGSDQQNAVTRRTRTATRVDITAPKPAGNADGGGDGLSACVTLLGLMFALWFRERRY